MSREITVTQEGTTIRNRRLAMKRSVNDPLVKAVRKKRRQFDQTPVGKLEKLLSEESRWKRKQTIAENKLTDVRRQIITLAREHAETLNAQLERWDEKHEPGQPAAS